MHFFVFRPEEYKKKVAEYVKKYATEEALRDACGGEVSVLYLIIHLDNYNPTIISYLFSQDDLSSSSESSMSDFSEDEAKDMEL